MTVLVLVSLLQRVSPKLSLPLGSAWLLWQIYLSIAFTIRIQDTVWSWKQRLNLKLQYCIFRCDCKTFLCPRRGQIAHCFTEEHRRIVQFRLISNLLRSIVFDNFSSSDNFSNLCSYSCSRSPCRSSLACISARGGCVRISTLSNWPGALWPTGNSSIMSRYCSVQDPSGLWS